MAKYRMYAYAHMNDTKVIQIVSLGDLHTKITETTKVEPGVISSLITIFEKGKIPFPLEFVWVPDKHIPPSFTNAVKPGTDFSLDLRLRIADDSSNESTRFDLEFAQCKLIRSTKLGNKVKVEASCNYFRASS